MFIGGVAWSKIIISHLFAIQFKLIDSKSCRINSCLSDFPFYEKILLKCHWSRGFFALFKLISTVCYPGSVPFFSHKTSFKLQGSACRFPIIICNFQSCQISGKRSQFRSIIHNSCLLSEFLHPVIHRQHCFFQQNIFL